MKTKNFTLRCYAEREADGSWFAICIDLNLVAQGATSAEVKTKLQSQIRAYVRQALTVDAQYADSLLPRRAPFGFIAKYYFLVTMRKLLGPPSHSSPDSSTFTEPMPLAA